MTDNEMTGVLGKLKRLDFSHARATFWIIKRKGKPSEPELSSFYVATEPPLQRKLADIVRRIIERANRVKPYDYSTADLEEEDALAVNSSETIFDRIQQQVASGSDAPQITKADELNDSWAYLIDVEVGKKHVLAVHKIVGGWALRKQSLLVKVLFRNSALVDYEDAPVFQLERKVDFIAFEDTLFILDKAKFESVLNFRLGMERKRDELLDDFGKMDLLSDTGVLREAIGTNLHLLRRVASVKKNGYYQDKRFLTELKTVCKKYGWGVEWKDGRIVVTPENAEVVLKLLNNDRLESPVNAEIFDVMVKNRVRS